MNAYHREILNVLKEVAGKGKVSNPPPGYLGNDHPSYALTVPQTRAIAKAWAKDHKDLSETDFIDLLDSLCQAPSTTEKAFASLLLGYMPKLRNGTTPLLLDKWLNHLEGWAEVDSLCQNVYTYKELLANWPAWKKLLEDLSGSENINKRRASLVLLTGPVVYSDDRKLADIAFANIEKLEHERAILITKAISWLLRSLITNHRPRVAQYLQDHAETLPKIAIRETRRKLTTGKK